jgi:excisionase family DNA binding protein
MVIDLKALEGKAFTTEEAARAIGFHPDSVRRLCREGKLHAVKPPGHKEYIVFGDDLIRYLKGELPSGKGGKKRP